MKGATFETGSNIGYKSRGVRKPGSMLAITASEIRKYVVEQEADERGRWMKTKL